jgi:hypothetical protein
VREVRPNETTQDRISQGNHKTREDQTRQDKTRHGLGKGYHKTITRQSQDNHKTSTRQSQDKHKTTQKEARKHNAGRGTTDRDRDKDKG